MPRRPHKVQPIERFPVKPRADGRFQKRINGQLYYFGHDGDRAGALREYERVKHSLYAGRAPRPSAEDQDTLTVADLARRFLADKHGTIEAITFKQHRRALRRFVKFCGRGRVWADLTPDDFSEYRRRICGKGKLGSYAFNRERAGVVAMFNHADEHDWIDRPPKYGKMFRRVPKRDLRAGKVARLLGRDEVNALLGVSRPDLFAMILLALNGGFGAADCAALPRSAVDLDTRLIRFARTKNNIPRTVPLWPETAEAMRRVCARRPQDRHVFRTQRGNAWNGVAIAHEFAKTAERAGLALGEGVGIYAARHTFATLANEVRDTDARRHIMGRLLGNLDDVYVETFFVERLKGVTDHVRSRLQVAEVIGDAFLPQ